jgi:hypothetical protein
MFIIITYITVNANCIWTKQTNPGSRRSVIGPQLLLTSAVRTLFHIRRLNTLYKMPHWINRIVSRYDMVKVAVACCSNEGEYF